MFQIVNCSNTKTRCGFGNIFKISVSLSIFSLDVDWDDWRVCLHLDSAGSDCGLCSCLE